MAIIGDPKIEISKTINSVTTLHKLQNDFGFMLIGQSNIYAPNLKEREITNYIEKDGEETGVASRDTDGKLAHEPFDYYLEFMYFDNQDFTVTNAINNFKSFVEGVDELTIVNYYAGVKIIGRYLNIEMTTFDRKKYDNKGDFASFKINFRVAKPNKCNFNGLV